MRFAVVVVLVACGGGNDSIDASAGSDGPSDTAVPDAAPDALLPAPMYAQTELYIKASNTDGGDHFGTNVAFSGDGSTLAVSAPFEASNATGIDGDQNDDSVVGGNGAVYVFARAGGTWAQQAYLKPSNSIGARGFGASVAISDDGNTIAVGASNEGSCATGVNGDQSNQDCGVAGAVYLFVRANNAWSQQAYIKPSNTTYQLNGHFGDSVALSGDSNTLVVGAPGEASTASGINGPQTTNTRDYAGAAYVFTRSGTTWTQQAYVKASSPGQNYQFGNEVALSSNGDVMAISSTQDALMFPYSGAVNTFQRTNGTWSETAYLKASNAGLNDEFGRAIALSGSGKTLVVGAPNESSKATGIGGDQTDDSELHAGAVYVFVNAGTWAQQAYVKGVTSYNGDIFGQALALSIDGNTVVVGSPGDDRAGTGFTSPQGSTNGDSGAAYVFHRSGATWTQLHYVKASNAGAADSFGFSVGITSDAGAFAVGASNEASNATGIGNDQTNNSLANAGATYLIQ